MCPYFMFSSRENISSWTLYDVYCVLDLHSCWSVYMYTQSWSSWSVTGPTVMGWHLEYTQTRWVSNTYSTSLQSNANALHTASRRHTITAGWASILHPTGGLQLQHSFLDTSPMLCNNPSVCVARRWWRQLFICIAHGYIIKSIPLKDALSLIMYTNW